MITSLLLIWLFACKLAECQSECQSNPYYEYLENARIHNMTIQQLLNVTDHTLQAQHFNRKDSSLYYVKGEKQGQELIICLPPKSGSTRIKMILNRMMDHNYRGQLTHEYQRYDRFNPVEYLQPSQISSILNNKNIRRFILTRNPYVRVVSMYQDKIIRQSMKRSWYRENIGFKNDKVSFPRFVELLYKRPKDPKMHKKLLNQHFVTQTKICSMDIGMSYNTILQVEQINEWYDCFIDTINMREELMHGWPDQNQCYFSSPKTPCNGPYMENGILKKTNKHTTNHNTQSANQIDQFFKNRTLVDMVTQTFLEDLINFNYQKL